MSDRVVILCPGRGSYRAEQLGSLVGLEEDERLQELNQLVEAGDVERRERGLRGLRELDSAERFGSEHLAAANAAPLTFAVTVRDFLRLDADEVEPVAVGGNSMGWYSALFCAGALDLRRAWRLVRVMAEATDAGPGGQLVYPRVDEDWRFDPGADAAVREALEEAVAAEHRAGLSIRFGGYAVLWGDDAALGVLAEQLPERRIGQQQYPLRLLGNAGFHSPLMAEASQEGVAALEELGWASPSVPLLDGRGFQWLPLSAEPDDLAEYTLVTQVIETFDFTATVRVALREYAPDRIVLLGPGDSLGGAVAQVMIREGWQGIDSREAFTRRQREEPFLVSMARAEQAELVTHPFRYEP